MTTFVLVHAAFHGDWVWHRLADQLAQMGHRAVTPSFPADPAGGNADLSAHVMALLACLDHLAETEVVLVAQSYGGLVATVAAARMPARIAALIYVDAVLPAHGKSMLETIPTAFAEAYRARQTVEGGRSVILPSRAPSADLRRAEDRALVAHSVAPQPFASFDEPADLMTGADALAGLPRHYLHCSAHSIDPSAALYVTFARQAATDRCWIYRDLPLGFYGALSAPGSLAEALVEAVHGASGGLSGRRLRRVLEVIDTTAGGPLAVADLAEIAGLSVWHFARCFKRSVGVPPHTYLARRRMETAAQLLRQGELPLVDIARRSGFSSASRFATAFRQATGMAPSAFRNQHAPGAAVEPGAPPTVP